MSAAPETTIPVHEHKTTCERVNAIATWLVDGKLRPECVASAMREWQVSRRTAQVYVARAARRIVKATTFEDPLFAMKLSQVQRDRLHQDLQELLRRGECIPFPIWQMKLKTIQADLKLLDSRDRTAAKLLQAAASLPPPLREPLPPPLRGRAGVGGAAPRDDAPAVVTRAEPVRETLRDQAPSPPDAVAEPLPPPLRGRAGVGGCCTPRDGTAPSTEPAQPRELLRTDPSHPKVEEKTRPRPVPQPNRLAPELMDAARHALAIPCAATTN